MKKAILMLFMCISLMAQAQQKAADRFSLAGTVPDQKEGLLYLGYYNSSGKWIADSTKLKEGTFSFAGTIRAPTLAFLSSQNSFPLTIFLEPVAMSGTFPKDDFQKATIQGSKTQDLFAGLEKEKAAIKAKHQKTIDLWVAEVRAKGEEEKINSLRENMAPYFKETNQADYVFMGRHPQSYVTAYIIKGQIPNLPIDSLDMYYSRLGEEVQQTKYAQELFKEIEGVRGGSTGSKAIPFSSVDIDGKPLSLADYQGKYVLLDFWGSWCGPCRKGHPHLIGLYQQYKDKEIEFISIACSDTPAAWRKAVEKDGIGIWKHIQEESTIMAEDKNDKTGKITDQYGVHAFPTKILINPEGLIVGRYSENDNVALDAKLKAVLSTK